MVNEELIRAQLKHVLDVTDYRFLGTRYQGKVRDSYTQGAVRYLITSDRLSCFDVVVSTIPFKGEVLNRIALDWFERSKHIVPNHIIGAPDPNVMVVRECKILPVEIVVRGYLAGSGWRDYAAGRPISGVTLPPGLKMSQKLPEVLLTPSIKAPSGEHDQPISEAEIVQRGLVTNELWQRVREIAFALFELGTRRAEQNGLILVDTKYELGLVDGELILADEIHTLDCSRYWVAQSYAENFERGTPPEMLDKEPVRQWLLSQGYKGEGPIPNFSDERRSQIARHYIASAERILGATLTLHPGPVGDRVEQALRAYSR
ncbi:MAG: phosphoribosylaminoimidazolesuccinocarboxamide synthase [Oligoflexia bacterium]|nr:phosphoribosylaminoimidazolesuccinocarboxamide synthase [Oligoflexia bacterium]